MIPQSAAEDFLSQVPLPWTPAEDRVLERCIHEGRALLNVETTDQPLIYSAMGRVAYRLQRYAECEEFNRMGLDLHPSRELELVMRNNLAVALIALGRPDEALSEVMSAAQLAEDGESIGAYLTCTMVDAAWASGRQALALSLLPDARAACDSDSIFHAWRLAETYALVGEHLRAAGLVARVIAALRGEDVEREWGMGLPSADWWAGRLDVVALTADLRASVAFAQEVARSHRTAGGGNSNLSDMGWIDR